MRAEKMLCRWAEQRWDLTEVVRVEIVHEEGWGGSDVTPGDPDEFYVTATMADGSHRRFDDMELTTDLITEILTFALTRKDPT